VNLGEALEPSRLGADVGVGLWMEVAVTAFFIAPEDYYRSGAGGDVVEEFLGAGEMVGPCAQVAPEQRG